MKLQARYSPATLRRRIELAIATPDPIESNQRVTRVHAELARAIQNLIGVDAGPNFHHWATWGSHKAGETIGQRQVSQAVRDLSIVLAAVAVLVGLIAGSATSSVNGLMVGPVVAIALIVPAGCFLIRKAMRRSAAMILEGNRTVLDDIGRKTAEFLGCFDNGLPNRRKLRAFFQQLRRGASGAGGQDLMRRAFRQYLKAATSNDRKERNEAVYFGNCLAVLHEHYRLQGYIEASMPRLVRRYATRFLMKFQVGRFQFAVHQDLPGIQGQAFPALLQEIADPKLVRFLSKWDRSDGQLAGTGVADWSKLEQRMSFIVNLFRMLHGAAGVAA